MHFCDSGVLMGVSVPCGGLAASRSLSPEIFGNPWNLRGQQGLGKEARTRVSRVPTLLGPPSLRGSVQALAPWVSAVASVSALPRALVLCQKTANSQS